MSTLSRVARRPKVLLVAEAANPEWPSVPLVGWNLCRALQQVVDAHVVTQIRNREALERAGWREGREYTVVDSEPVARPIWRFTEALQRATGLGWTASTALASLSYYYFERLVWKRFGDAVAGGAFDLVHRVTPLSPTIPSTLASRCSRAGVPFVWGPINGGVAWPREFSDLQRQEGEWLSYVRGFHRLMPGYRSSRAGAAAILVGSRDTWKHLAGYHGRCVYLPENAVDPSTFGERVAGGSTGPLNVAFVGRLVPLKGVDMLIEAAAPLIRAGRLVLHVVGDGPLRETLLRQVEESGLGSGVRMHGWVKHDELAQRLSGCHVFAFPSIKDFGGAVVLEAMAMGLVPIVVDHGGPAELISARTGYRVPLGPRPALVAGFREVLARLEGERDRLGEVGERARRRVLARFTWETKAHQVLEVYRWVLGERDKPDFGMPFPDDEVAGTGSPGADSRPSLAPASRD
jgi:glycosyltransferase involved in cell wall biosynthesis